MADLVEFLASPDDVFCSSLTILTLLMLLSFPCWVFFQIKKNFKSLSHPDTVDRLGIIYKEFDT